MRDIFQKRNRTFYIILMNIVGFYTGTVVIKKTALESQVAYQCLFTLIGIFMVLLFALSTAVILIKKMSNQKA